ncbi:MAG: CBS domain-containing protein [Candidatus Pelagadaptatus aseana]|uniref:CBS domain-containing protein n=1 Tax=Candidatus Pelagadaptatus aseana TaxID=3120508 RepID=UPI0039B175B1
MNKTATHTVAEIMTTTPKTVTPDVSLEQLANIFERVSYHHIPVVDNGKLVGIISDRDISVSMSPFLGTEAERNMDRDLLQKSANDIMTNQVVCADEDTDLDTASILLLENNFSCLPVTDAEDHLLGLLTWKDLLQYFVYAR